MKRRTVVVLGPTSSEVEAALRRLGLQPLEDDSGDASIWLPEGLGLGPQPRSWEAQQGATDRGPQVLTITEASTVLGLRRAAIYEAIARGELDVVQTGAYARVPRKAVEELLGGRKEGQGAQSEEARDPVD